MSSCWRQYRYGPGDAAEWHADEQENLQSTSCFEKFPARDDGVISELICLECGLGHGPGLP
jgi:hypothetical protein